MVRQVAIIRGLLCWSLTRSELDGICLDVLGGILTRPFFRMKEIGLGDGLGIWRSLVILWTGMGYLDYLSREPDLLGQISRRIFL